MDELIIVNTGEIKSGDSNTILKSSPIGSCVVVLLFDEIKKTGGMAHIMLPGRAPEKEGTIKTRYAENAIEHLIFQIHEAGIGKENLKAVIVGGGNVLKRIEDTIGVDNFNSVVQILNNFKLEIKASLVKGTERRSVRFDIPQGTIYVATGDDKEKLLYKIY